MTDASDESPAEQAADPPDSTARPEADDADRPGSGADDRPSPEEVEAKYDFEDFGPREMAEMSYEEWEVAFDHDSWITGEELLDRAEADLKSRVADRDVFAVVERIEQDGEPRLVAYSDEGYAVVYPDGTVEGSGTVLRDVKPTIALASMESYEVPEPPEGDVLPDPAEVPEGSGKLGNQLMQVVAAVHVLAGVALFAAWIAVGLPIVAAVAAGGFLLFGVFVFLLVANARLSDRFRAEEYRNRLRAVGMEDGDRPEFLPGGESADAEDVPDGEGPLPDEESFEGNLTDEKRPDEDGEHPSDGTTEGVSSASESGS
jgi:hypothetical protein